MTEGHPPCRENALALHALADGELDAMSAQTLELHLRGCPGCRAALERIEGLHSALSAPEMRDTAPAALRRSIEDMGGVGTSANARSNAPRPMAPWIGGGAIGALAASLVMLLLMPQLAAPQLADALVDSQIRSLQGGHLVDVETSDRHTVKPWFNGRIAFAPPVVDLKDRGFPLVGGRLDVLAGENVAVLVYKRRLHTINLFIRPRSGGALELTEESHRAGYNIVHWAAGGLEYWAVSDLEGAELREFGTIFAAS